MAGVSLFVVFLLTHVVLLPSSAEKNRSQPINCPFFFCGEKLGVIGFPFNSKSLPECGLYTVDCTENSSPKIQLKEGGHWYEVDIISQANKVVINDTALQRHLDSHMSCEDIKSFSLPSPSVFANVSTNETRDSLTVFNCSSHIHGFTPPKNFNHSRCGDYDMYYTNINTSYGYNYSNSSPSLALQYYCSKIQLPVFHNLRHSKKVTLDVAVSPECFECHYGGGQCQVNSTNQFYCSFVPKNESSTVTPITRHNKSGLPLELGLASGIGIPSILLLIFGLWSYKQKRASPDFHSRTTSEDPCLTSDAEGGRAYFGVPVFSYKGLEEATNNFDPEKELGNGGFGTVYHGKLKDGREVAVKRLYEHNYKRLEQFVNEIEILTRLRHKNLVSLYGCTSPCCRDLLLVYEYIPNGTVADHLHGNRANTSPLTWPIRMSIAIETACALAYLHASDIVHRDVKTNNILLENNFCVKVADFGLSRLFPNDVTHVSTAPQGTPGYVDPEYHLCYQLTSKSDVYSFGVVLVELISSMPAIDITRHKHEVNLSNFALSKIQKRAYNELIDPCLGFNSDFKVKTMTIAVAELAFQCLQQDKELRPTMDEVLEALKRIQSVNNEIENDDQKEAFEGSVRPPPSSDWDKVSMLKRTKREEPPSPNTVTENWSSSRSSTPIISG